MGWWWWWLLLLSVEVLGAESRRGLSNSWTDHGDLVWLVCFVDSWGCSSEFELLCFPFQVDLVLHTQVVTAMGFKCWCER